MPNIRSSADLRNGYNEISSFCRRYGEPVFITKNGKGDWISILQQELMGLSLLESQLFLGIFCL